MLAQIGLGTAAAGLLTLLVVVGLCATLLLLGLLVSLLIVGGIRGWNMYHDTLSPMVEADRAEASVRATRGCPAQGSGD